MSNVLLLNLHQKYDGIANGNLTRDLLNSAKEFFIKNNFDIKETNIDNGYDINEELEKFQWADIFFVQSPVYWMGLPWLGKKYIDDIFSAGTGKVTYLNDGRSRSDSSKKYGSGGLMQDKIYMLSFTYNCPKSEFNNKDGFFDGLTVDEANIAIHKTFQFCGAKPTETFAIYDVYKSDFSIDKNLENLNKILNTNFGESKIV